MPIRSAMLADATAIARVHVDSWRTTYRGLFPDAFLADLSYEQRAEFWSAAIATPQQGQRIYVAEDAAGQVIGFAAGGPEREGDSIYAGDLYAIYLLASEQRAGLGRLLVHAIAQGLLDDGMPSVLVWVLAENPARRFYEALRGQYIREKHGTVGDLEITEVAYGWPDIRELIDACANP
jgi:GNAT superfamily N-acetyltransferase